MGKIQRERSLTQGTRPKSSSHGVTNSIHFASCPIANILSTWRLQLSLHHATPSKYSRKHWVPNSFYKNLLSEPATEYERLVLYVADSKTLNLNSNYCFIQTARSVTAAQRESEHLTGYDGRLNVEGTKAMPKTTRRKVLQMRENGRLAIIRHLGALFTLVWKLASETIQILKQVMQIVSSNTTTQDSALGSPCTELRFLQITKGALETSTMGFMIYVVCVVLCGGCCDIRELTRERSSPMERIPRSSDSSKHPTTKATTSGPKAALEAKFGILGRPLGRAPRLPSVDYHRRSLHCFFCGICSVINRG